MRRREQRLRREFLYQRPKWTPPPQPTEPLATPLCVSCGKIIRDITTALEEQQSHKPIHFECALEELNKHEHLESGDSIAYIGGGRFAILHTNFRERRKFSIKKIVVYEPQAERSEWRKSIGERYQLG
ncbi:hypothetical protein PilKf_00141 [Pillotina sp. SPG140]|jgi:hypothetical protein